MTMLLELSLTDARKDFSRVFNEVYNAFRPTLITRNKSEELLLMRRDLMKELLSCYSLKPDVIKETDGSITLSLDALDIYVNDASLDSAREQLVEDLKFYAQDYLQRSQLFLHAPNRRGHFPYVLRILLCDTIEELKELLEV